MRICIIGNCHIACLRSAWNLREDKPSSFSLDFFAAIAGGLKALELRDGCLVTSDQTVAEFLRITSGGRDRIRLADYDAFLVGGLGLQVGPLVQGISSAVVSQCCEDLIASALALRVALMIKSQTDAPIYMAHVPLVAAAAPLPDHRSYTELHELMELNFALRNMHLLQQPVETILFPCSTHIRFSEGPAALQSNPKTGRPGVMQEDGKHMNSAFGELYLRDFFERLRKDQPPVEAET